LKNHFTKISLFILIVVVFVACNSTRKVPVGKRFLAKNEILINGKKESSEELTNLLVQKPNTSILGYRLRLNLYNLANIHHDSTFRTKHIDNPDKYRRLSKWLSEKQVHRLGKSFWYAGIHEFLKKTGEPPVIIDSLSASKSTKRLNAYYYNKGFFNTKTIFSIDSIRLKKGKINYTITTGQAFMVDSIKTTIKSPVLDSLYQVTKNQSNLKTNKQYLTEDFENERGRLTTYFRNNGAYLFQQNYINFDIDTLVSSKKANVEMKIGDYSYRVNDSTKTEPFKIYKISDVNIVTDYSSANKNSKFTDSITYKKFNLYSFKKLRYRPKAITDAIFINKEGYFSDTRTNLTSRYLNNLKIFNYPTINYQIDPRDSLGRSLIATIYLTPKKKYNFATNLDASVSNIQRPGITFSPSLLIRNVFNGAETFEASLRYNIGSSKESANPNNVFFNVLEYGLDTKLHFPRILMFFNTEKIIPKRMIPSTTFSVGLSKQENIGLDKESFSSTFAFNWTPRANTTAQFELFNIQFVNNLNVENYFNIYQSSYNTLNNLATKYQANTSYFNPNGQLIIEDGITGFLNDVKTNNLPSQITSEDFKSVVSVLERANRLTENNLIFATSYQFSQTTKKDLKDETFHVFKTKFESAGNFLSLLANASKKLESQDGSNTFLDVEYSQYFKTELEYIKHWDLSLKKVFAFRSFIGIAVPYGNSNSVPFSRSYFAGGANDIRAWQPYSLGPGKSGGFFDFNEANLKMTFSAEFRFNIFSQLNAALFADAGNIWNVFDNVKDEIYTFNGIKSMQDFALGTGLGLRYDFNYFVFRVDLGFKTYNPAKLESEKWFRELNFSKSVLNIGINYPF
jgi:outer membrane protein assembly factor BamA